jgi:hypothetical protein
MSADLFGPVEQAPTAPFRDIRNTRESVAEEKARLCLELLGLCRAPPRSLNSASVNRVREWRAAHKSALKVLASKASSRGELSSAINSMRSFEQPVTEMGNALAALKGPQ